MTTPTDREIIAAIRWLRKEITTKEFSLNYTTNLQGANSYLFKAAKALREAYQRGLIKVDTSALEKLSEQ